MRVRSSSASRKPAFSVRASRIVDRRALARGWSTTSTSMRQRLDGHRRGPRYRSSRRAGRGAEVEDRGGEGGAGVLLEEVAGAGDRGVYAAGGTGKARAQDRAQAGGDRVAV